MLREARHPIPTVQFGAIPLSSHLIDQMLAQESGGSVLILGHLLKVHCDDLMLLVSVLVYYIYIASIIDAKVD